MNRDLTLAKESLKDNTIFLVKGEHTLSSTKTGIAPMMDFISRGLDLGGYSAADKIVGKAAALLFAKAGIRAVFAKVLSERALPILKKFNIQYEYETLTKNITNRLGTGTCPMELTVADTDSPDTAFALLQEKLNSLGGGKK